MVKARAAIIGSGNIGTDLMYKLERSPHVEPVWMVGIDPNSDGLKRAKQRGLTTYDAGLERALTDGMSPDIVFDATSAKAHLVHAKLLEAERIQVVDLTPGAVGPYVVPAVNLHEHRSELNVNMVTCGGQATIPIVAAISRITPVRYAEIVATISSRSAGPGTRQNIDEFTKTTARALEVIGKAERGKAIIILNPADPPILMRDTIYCQLATMNEDVQDDIVRAIKAIVERVERYVPGYRLNREPIFREDVVSISLEVEGLGDYLPVYAGNLDIMTAAAVAVGEQLVQQREHEKGGEGV